MNIYLDTTANRQWLWQANAIDPRQPHLVRYCAVAVDDDGVATAEARLCGLPHGEGLDAAALERLNVPPDEPFMIRDTMPGVEVVDAWLKMLIQADVVAAHSAAFHRKLLEATCNRVGMALPILPWFCTMTESTEIVKLAPPSGRGKSKWPKLEEAVAFFDKAAESPPSQVKPLAEGLANCERVRIVYEGIMRHRSPAGV